jgi:hypothetical protein
LNQFTDCVGATGATVGGIEATNAGVGEAQVCEPATTLNAAQRRKPLIDLSDEHKKLVKPERRFTAEYTLQKAALVSGPRHAT